MLTAARACLWGIVLISGGIFVKAHEVSALKTQNIMVIHSYHQGLQWTDSISAGIQSEFKELGEEIELHYEYLDTKRNSGEDYFNRIVQFERRKTKLSDIPFEAIICSDNNALRFILENRNDLYPGIPLVFCGINNFSPDMLKGHSGITGVPESIDYSATLDLIVKFHPERRHILVILDKTPTGVAIKKEFMQTAARYDGILEFEYFQDFVLEEVPAKISNLGSGDAIYLLTFNQDREGNFISYTDGIRMIQREAKVPIYGSWDFYFGNGIVGGMITSGFFQGQDAARLVKKILSGMSPEDLPVVSKSPNRFMFDHRQLEQFGIRKTDLPADAIVINQPPPFIEKYTGYIALAAGITLLILPVLVWRLSAQRREKKALEKLNLELDLRLESAMSKVKILSGFLPICSHCKKIRDEQGTWTQMESYIDKHSEAKFSHGMCPDCCDEFYGNQEWYKSKKT